MKNKQMKRFIALLTCVMSFAVFASEKSAMDIFFAKEENQKKFDMVKLTGTINKGKQKMVSMCEKIKQTKKESSKLDCACYKSEVAKISDKEFFYGSVLAYQQFLERAAAQKEDDQSKYEALKKSHAQQPGFVAKIEKQCGK